jgi:hypothetical protein
MAILEALYETGKGSSTGSPDVIAGVVLSQVKDDLTDLLNVGRETSS